MANFYLDNSDLKHHLNHPLMKKLVALRERNYSDAEKYDYAPFNFEDAMDSYEKVLEIAGEISGEIVAANRPRRSARCRRTRRICQRHAKKPRRSGKSRIDGYLYPPSLQRA